MLIILEDTRNKPGKHDLKGKYFEENGILIRRTKIYCGDYCLPVNQSVCIDSKQNLQEVVGDLIQQHERFRAEADRAVEAGITLYVLIEEPGMKTLEDVKRWENPRLHRYNKIKYMHSIGKWQNIPSPKGKPPVDNITLYKIMYTFAKKHGVVWEFCDPKDAGRRIVEILTGKEG